jgi:hypothetical protein
VAAQIRKHPQLRIVGGYRPGMKAMPEIEDADALGRGDRGRRSSPASGQEHEIVWGSTVMFQMTP